MMTEEDIGRYALDAMPARGEARTRPDAPEIELDENFWHNARVVMPDQKGKTPVYMRVDSEVLEWFKRQGKGHLTRMNAVLRAYVEAQKGQR